jgi:hypothetical protein
MTRSSEFAQAEADIVGFGVDERGKLVERRRMPAVGKGVVDAEPQYFEVQSPATSWTSCWPASSPP